MRTDRELLIRYADGTLEEHESKRVRERLENEPSLRAQLSRLEALRQTLGEGRSDSFAPYFSDRVMERLTPAVAEASEQSLYDSLRFVFARMAVACLLAAGALATYNFVDYHDTGVASSVPEALFGLPSASLMDALTYGTF